MGNISGSCIVTILALRLKFFAEFSFRPQQVAQSIPAIMNLSGDCSRNVFMERYDLWWIYFTLVEFSART